LVFGEMVLIMSDIVSAFKGFDANLACRGFQYQVGDEFEHDEKVIACSKGFHACEYALDVFAYYPPNDSRFCAVESTGEISRSGIDSKVASARIKIVAEIGIPEIVTAAVSCIMKHIDGTLDQTVVPGNYSASTNTGDSSAATNAGYSSASTNTGDNSASTNTGFRSASTSTGDRSAATNTGNRSASTNTGDRSASTNTGDSSAATNAGYSSASTNTGDNSAATNAGHYSASTNTGNYSASTVEGTESVAIATGYEGRAKACIGSAIVLCRRDEAFSLTHVFASKVGENGIEADVFYMLDSGGKPVKWE
jgi:hypothetical protein